MTGVQYRLLLTKERQELVVHRRVAHDVHEHVDACSHDGLLIGECRRMRVNQHLVLVRLVDHRVVDLGRHLGIRAPPVVHPDLHAPDISGRHGLHGRSSLLRRGDLIHDVQRGGGLDQNRVRTTARWRHARHEKETRCGRKLPRLLSLLKLEGLLGRAAADRLRGADAVERLALQVVEDVARRVVLRTPRCVAFVSDVHVYVDHRGHDRLARQLDASRTSGRRHAALRTKRHDAAVFDHERPVLYRRAAIPCDQPAAFVDDGRR